MIPAVEWWAVIHNYSRVVFPVQIALYLLSVSAVCFLIFKPGKTANKFIRVFLLLAFSWIGFVFFLLLGRDLPAYRAQTFLFVSLAVLFAADLVIGNSRFCLPEAGRRRYVVLIGFGLVLAYPVFGLLLGRLPSGWIVPGAFPCPTTALALVFMMSAVDIKRRWLYLVTTGLLLLWAVPFPIFIQIPQFGVYEDSIMAAVGIYTAMVLVSEAWKEHRALT